MWPFSAWRSLALPHRVAAAAVFAIAGAVGFLPLFGGPGYEQSLASGLVLPTAAAIATALALSGSCPAAPLVCVTRGISSGAMLAGVAFATALLHGLRVGMCDLWGGARRSSRSRRAAARSWEASGARWSPSCAEGESTAGRR